MPQARTLKQVNNKIQKVLGDYLLCKGEGYFYVCSDDPNIGLKLAGLETTSIPVCYLKHQTVDQWVSDVRGIITNL